MTAGPPGWLVAILYVGAAIALLSARRDRRLLIVALPSLLGGVWYVWTHYYSPATGLMSTFVLGFPLWAPSAGRTCGAGTPTHWPDSWRS